jgi:hypothetical protein
MGACRQNVFLVRGENDPVNFIGSGRAHSIKSHEDKE